MSVADVIPHLPEISKTQAEKWLAATIAEAEAHFSLDGERMPSVNDPAVIERAEKLHAALARWVDDAEALHLRLNTSILRGQLFRLPELDRAVGHARVRLSMPPDAPDDDDGEGRPMSMEELRRELRDRREAQAAARPAGV